MWNIALLSSRTQFPVRRDKVRTITPQIMLLAMQLEAEVTDVDEEPTMPFIALASAPA
ncbi:MAG: hypothetical protein H0T46_10595 [Deltaproteobacteria bacterium]|nr:hypothetical protein [Deltaproteobacteria bacterium]